VRSLSDELAALGSFHRVVGDSPAWRAVLTQATQVAGTETTVLLQGESGTGKEVVARFIHRGSARQSGPFIAINCAALPEQLLESELFGYERGAFTGATQSKPGQIELAAGGTLFLDEVAEMSPSAQAKFLRVLQEKEFQRLGSTRRTRADVRVIAATNRDLARSIERGTFREDLFYRLHVFGIRLPPLRERPEDILPLSDAFLHDLGRSFGRPPAGISREARDTLLSYTWPGNVRELRNVLERAAILCQGGLILADHLGLRDHASGDLTPRQPAPREPLPSAPEPAPEPAPAAAPRETPIQSPIQTMERAMIERALHDTRYNKSKAARQLGLTRTQLYVRLKRYGLE
jgi:transcriptional regulator with PAS, ATPase and Fis domain